MGHSSIKVTETYLKPFENEKVDIANDELIISVVAHNGEKEVAWGISYDSHSNKRRITYQVIAYIFLTGWGKAFPYSVFNKKKHFVG